MSTVLKNNWISFKEKTSINEYSSIHTAFSIVRDKSKKEALGYKSPLYGEAHVNG